MKKIILQGYISVPPESLQAIKAELPKHIALTRSEPGCIYFSVEQDQNNPNNFTVYEEFSSQAAFDHHQMRVLHSDWGRLTAGIERHYTISTMSGNEITQPG